MTTQKTFDGQTATFLSKLIASFPGDLTGEEMQKCIDNPRGLRDAICSFIRPTAKVWKTWKTIQLGTGLQTASDFRRAVKSAGMKIGDWADDILDKPSLTVAGSVTEVELVVASVAELGFKGGTTRKDIYARAKELGLDLCPPEVGPQLRLQYTDQPKGEWLVIAMEPITDSDGTRSLFRVIHDVDGRWLHSHSGHPVYVWGGDDRLVFLRRK